jgi:tRNA modification GTPase
VIRDTIVALATPPGPGLRAIVRVSGPDAAAAVRAVFRPAEEVPPPANRLLAGSLILPGVHSPLPATLYFWHAPKSYTGEDVAELHLVSCPPLVEALVAALLAAGCRAAGPGEFTQRAFLSGKLDLTRAEAVHAVIEATGRAELKHALAQLAGGMAKPMAALREDLLDLLADVEAALDFADEDIEFVDPSAMLLRLGRAMAQVTVVAKQLDSRALANRAFRVVLSGRPNAGKSSLFNALAGTSALVSPTPGTTRDYLTATLRLGSLVVELIDTPGREAATGDIGAQAQTLGTAQRGDADLVLVCVEGPLDAEEEAMLGREKPPAVLVRTKGDLEGMLPSPPSTGARGSGTVPLTTSALTGEGLADLRALFAARAAARPAPALAPSASRCKNHVGRCLEHLRRAHALVLEGDPPEILALELREALHQLGEMVGAVYTEDLLDRIFSRFCIGK